MVSADDGRPHGDGIAKRDRPGPAVAAGAGHLPAPRTQAERQRLGRIAQAEDEQRGYFAPYPL
jgi:hypothetical protein